MTSLHDCICAGAFEIVVASTRSDLTVPAQQCAAAASASGNAATDQLSNACVDVEND
jgi:hypothetical protein